MWQAFREWLLTGGSLGYRAEFLHGIRGSGRKWDEDPGAIAQEDSKTLSNIVVPDRLLVSATDELHTTVLRRSFGGWDPGKAMRCCNTCADSVEYTRGDLFEVCKRSSLYM